MADSYSVRAILSAQDKGFSSALKGAGSAVDSLGGKLKSGLSFGVFFAIGTKAVSAVAGGLKGLVSNVIETGKSFETAMSQVQATMDLDKSKDADLEALEKLTQSAKELGATTKYTATEAAEALNYLALAGYDADKPVMTRTRR